MARKLLNRLALREEVEAAAKAGITDTTKKTAKKATTPRKSRKKEAPEIRVKLFWGVFNQSLKRVALFEFNQKKQADKKAEELSQGGKAPHFVQKVKEAVDG
jgi:hypothetical protein